MSFPSRQKRKRVPLLDCFRLLACGDWRQQCGSWRPTFIGRRSRSLRCAFYCSLCLATTSKDPNNGTGSIGESHALEQAHLQIPFPGGKACCRDSRSAFSWCCWDRRVVHTGVCFTGADKYSTHQWATCLSQQAPLSTPPPLFMLLNQILLRRRRFFARGTILPSVILLALPSTSTTEETTQERASISWEEEQRFLSKSST